MIGLSLKFKTSHLVFNLYITGNIKRSTLINYLLFIIKLYRMLCGQNTEVVPLHERGLCFLHFVLSSFAIVCESHCYTVLERPPAPAVWHYVCLLWNLVWCLEVMEDVIHLVLCKVWVFTIIEQQVNKVVDFQLVQVCLILQKSNILTLSHPDALPLQVK